LTQIWLSGDHYKWRAMRSNGVSEHYCTGGASDWEKFEMWARTVPYTLRNPLYHWTHMELKNPFEVKGQLLDPSTARAIYDHCNQKLAQDGFSTQGLLARFKVLVVCSTDDPVDSLQAHQRHGKDAGAATRLLPTWRPDRAMMVDDLASWNAWVDKLQAASGMSIVSFEDFLAALKLRHDFFHQVGCRISDHGIEQVYVSAYTDQEIKGVFGKARSRIALSPVERDQFGSAVLYQLALLDHAAGWT
jgi:glucuronate isomerase